MLVASLVSGRLITGAAECWDSVGDTSFVRLVHIHVRRRADAYAGLSELCTGSHQLGDSEIHQHWSTVEIEHDVVWFDVPMNEIAGVGEGECCGYALDDGDRCGRRLPAGGTQQLLECSAFKELHDHVKMSVADPKIANLHDVRVPQAGHTLGFLLETSAKVVGGDKLWSNELDGPINRKLSVKSLVDIGHAASAQPFRDLVWTNGGTNEDIGEEPED